MQARFEQVSKAKRIDPDINATALTAVVARDNQSAIVELRVRPSAQTWKYHMFLIVDKQYITLDESVPIVNLRGVTVYQPKGISNMSHVIAMFDSGAGVEVMTNRGHMMVMVYAPSIFMVISCKTSYSCNF